MLEKIKQPKVMGEIIGGILLGPSFLGYFFPETFNFLFPIHSLDLISILSQIGLVLFMFVVGMELDLKIIKKHGSKILFISHSSILIPYLLGLLLAHLIFKELGQQNASFLGFAMFMGISMSITAFPVLASIIKEKNINKTYMGTLALSCAAIDDVTAWFLLAFTISYIQAGSFFSGILMLVIGLIVLLVMAIVLKPMLIKIFQKYKKWKTLSSFMVLILFSLITETIGMHAVFGGFIAGIIIPDKDNSRNILSNKIEDLSRLVLLPLFFVYSGLKTDISSIAGIKSIGILLMIIVVAVSGKLIGTSIIARITGESWRNSVILGTLMNTRGLMELVVLNIGYDLGILNKEIFSMMVIMALTTTLMTGPLVTYLYKPEKNY